MPRRNGSITEAWPLPKNTGSDWWGLLLYDSQHITPSAIAKDGRLNQQFKQKTITHSDRSWMSLFVYSSATSFHHIEKKHITIWSYPLLNNRHILDSNPRLHILPTITINSPPTPTRTEQWEVFPILHRVDSSSFVYSSLKSLSFWNVNYTVRQIHPSMVLQSQTPLSTHSPCMLPLPVTL